MQFNSALPDDTVNVSDGSAAREAITLLVGACLVVIALVTAVGFALDLLIPHIPAAAEAKFFGGLWSHVSDEVPEADEIDGRTSELQSLLDRLALHWPDQPYEFRAAVVDAEIPNAFALPGGGIVVTSALLESVRSENELAFVLGHELGHFKGRDHLAGLGRGLALGLVLGSLGFGDGAAGLLVGSAGTLAQRPFDRDQERDADLFGVWIVGREYAHAGGSERVFDVLLESSADDAEAPREETLSHYFDSHPANPSRTSAIEQEAMRLGLPLEGPLAPWPPSEPREPDAAEAVNPDDALSGPDPLR